MAAFFMLETVMTYDSLPKVIAQPLFGYILLGQFLAPEADIPRGPEVTATASRELLAIGGQS